MNKLINLLRYIGFLPIAIAAMTITNRYSVFIQLKILQFIDEKLYDTFIGRIIFIDLTNPIWEVFIYYSIYVLGGILGGLVYAYSGYFVAPNTSNNKKIPVSLLIGFIALISLGVIIVNFTGITDVEGSGKIIFAKFMGYLIILIVSIMTLKKLQKEAT